MELTKEQKLRPAIEALKVTEFVDLPKDDFTASAARQAVQRIKEGYTFEQKEGRLKNGKIGHISDVAPKQFQVSETAYSGGTRVTRLA